ncbi:zinc metallopeptidase [Clostridium transplantifaecale]|uniref:zinc metallopeptidase n=1 Tax=Clostridium transplantifaecale TaxID=2479838 RepID=UPI000F643DA9|nr:zinc metallopeptidase [Clostridium transplantifaecale]
MYGYGYGYYNLFDPTMILVLIGVVLSMIASSKVQSTYAKYSRVRSMTGMTGAETAKRLLNSQGIYDVQVRRVAGNLTDHYDPRSKTVNLSESVYDSASVAAIGVAAHECGHAIQDNTEYVPLKVRGAIVPVVNIGTQLSWPMIILGIFIGGAGSPLVQIGILLFTLCVLFQLVTLPVEFNASSRAVKLLDETGILSGEEVGYTKNVLGAAALTYVAAAAGSILQLLRLLILFGGRRDDR